MSGALAQDLAVALLVGGSVAYLVRREWRRRTRKTRGCGSCPDCPAAAGDPARDALVSIGDPTPRP